MSPSLVKSDTTASASATRSARSRYRVLIVLRNLHGGPGRAREETRGFVTELRSWVLVVLRILRAGLNHGLEALPRLREFRITETPARRVLIVLRNLRAGGGGAPESRKKVSAAGFPLPRLVISFTARPSGGETGTRATAHARPRARARPRGPPQPQAAKESCTTPPPPTPPQPTHHDRGTPASDGPRNETGCARGAAAKGKG